MHIVHCRETFRYKLSLVAGLGESRRVEMTEIIGRLTQEQFLPENDITKKEEKTHSYKGYYAP